MARTRTQDNDLLGAIVAADALLLVAGLVSQGSWWVVVGIGLTNGASVLLFRRPKRRDP